MIDNNKTDCNKYSKDNRERMIKMKYFIQSNCRSFKPTSTTLMSMLLTYLLVLPNIAFASGVNRYENLANIRKTAKIFLEEMTLSADSKDVELNIGQIDPRLKLKLCDQPLIAFLPNGSKQYGKLSVGIRCNGPVAWKIYLSATVYKFQTVVFANNSLAKGQPISKHDLGYKRIRISNIRKKPVLDANKVIMTSPRRFIRAGSIIYTNSICMICKGSKVNVSAGGQYFSINMEAEALVDASVGDTVRLRNSKSRRIFSGTVIGRNKAKVLLLN